MRRCFPSLFLVLVLNACALYQPPSQRAEDATSVTLSPVSFSALPGWQNDPLESALLALGKSCAVMLKRDNAAPVAPQAVGDTIGQWRNACANIPSDATQARAYFETYFTPYRLDTALGNTGLFTGYYETMLNGSLKKTAQYNVPLYKRPSDLVMVELGDFRDHLKGERIAGRVTDGKLKPFEDRTTIENGALANKKLELVWVDDVDQAFFLHIQGSGRIKLTDGKVMRVGYDGQNGHVYQAIGRELIARGELTPETTNLHSIRAWLKAHPAEAPALRQKNASYVFFKELDGNDPVGAQGVELTATRSLAVDPRFVPYGAPVFLDVPHPTIPERRIERLMIAQDTGGAIRGPVRGDFFWGAGDAAENAAGLMKSRGAMWILLPKDVTPDKTVALAVKQ